MQSGHPQRHDQHSWPTGTFRKRPALQRPPGAGPSGHETGDVETEARSRSALCFPPSPLTGRSSLSAEPSVRELEILLKTTRRKGGRFRLRRVRHGVRRRGTEHCPMCGQHGEGGSVAGRIIGFVILLIISVPRLKYCPESFHAAFVFPPFTAAPRGDCRHAPAQSPLCFWAPAPPPLPKWACAAAEFYVAVYGVSSPCRRS